MHFALRPPTEHVGLLDLLMSEETHSGDFPLDGLFGATAGACGRTGGDTTAGPSKWLYTG
jgi:hypothetical protein